MTICNCTPPALQLLNIGLFPCAPTRPSLAVDLNMLDLVGKYFVHAAPNTTAWCDTLESFLGDRKYKLTTWVGFPSISNSNNTHSHVGQSSTSFRKCHEMVRNAS
jgi:hypothetical protein